MQTRCDCMLPSYQCADAVRWSGTYAPEVITFCSIQWWQSMRKTGKLQQVSVVLINLSK